MNQYIIKDSFKIPTDSSSQVLVLDHKLSLTRNEKLEMEVEGRHVPYMLTHNDFWIVVHDNENYDKKSVILN